MQQNLTNVFSHQKSTGDADYKNQGLRSFFLYRDLGIKAATGGRVHAVLVRPLESSSAVENGTGMHYHMLDFHIVYMIKGWAKFIYDGVDTLVEAGDCVHQRPGMVHCLYDWSDDMEYMEITSPGDFGTIALKD